MDPKAIAALARSAQVGPARTEPSEWAATTAQSGCSGKEAFVSRSIAAAVARRPVRHGRRVAYRCKHCGKWHVGTA